MNAPLALQKIERTSPTLWTHMRQCGLRALLAANPKADGWVLHDPRIWLGTAFHGVMRAIRSSTNSESAEAIWDTEIANAVRAAASHPFDKRYSSPERWPSYYLVRQRCLSLASKAARPKPGAQRIDHSTTLRGAEKRFEARSGRLVGKPDYFDGVTISEYKSTLPDAQWEGAASIIEGFKRQVQLYAAIIAEVTSRWPADARIVAASGQVLDIAIVPTECDAEADAAVAALDGLNSKLASGCTLEEVAEPASASCSACNFKTICPMFWQSLARDQLPSLKAAVMGGDLIAVDDGQDGDLYTARIAVRAASRRLSSEQPVVLRRSIHGELRSSAIGQRVRATDFLVKGDGRIRADISTVIVSATEIPELTSAISADQHDAVLVSPTGRSN
jgi:PD-(D/E)XK nuclease superfamily